MAKARILTEAEEKAILEGRIKILHNELKDVQDGLRDMESFEDAAVVQAFFDDFVYDLWTFSEFYTISPDLLSAVDKINAQFEALNEENRDEVEGNLFHTRRIGDVRAEPAAPARVVYADAADGEGGGAGYTAGDGYAAAEYTHNDTHAEYAAKIAGAMYVGSGHHGGGSY